MQFQPGQSGNPSGRPRKADLYAEQIATADAQIAAHLPQLLANLFALADGVMVKEVDDDGVVDIYAKPPDRKANEYLINRLAGTPTARREITGEDGGPISIRRAEELTDDELAAIIAECSAGADSA